jgi:hypothetical protein
MSRGTDIEDEEDAFDHVFTFDSPDGHTSIDITSGGRNSNSHDRRLAVVYHQ